jgi:hypothetical protein
MGHSGWYFDNATRLELNDAGLSIIDEKRLDYFWSAANIQQLAELCRSLFGMVRLETRIVAEGICDYLGVCKLENEVGLNWQLHCFACRLTE